MGVVVFFLFVGQRGGGDTIPININYFILPSLLLFNTTKIKKEKKKKEKKIIKLTLVFFCFVFFFFVWFFSLSNSSH
jgi:hypothetical protein